MRIARLDAGSCRVIRFDGYGVESGLPPRQSGGDGKKSERQAIHAAGLPTDSHAWRQKVPKVSVNFRMMLTFDNNWVMLLSSVDNNQTSRGRVSMTRRDR